MKLNPNKVVDSSTIPDGTDRGPIGRFKITRKDMTIRELYELFTHKKFDLHPAFQREEVAKLDFKQKLIKDIIRLGIPTNIIVRKLDDGRYQIIDGLQRLSAIFAYMGCEFKCEMSSEIIYKGKTITLPTVDIKGLHKCKNGDALFELLMKAYFNVTIYENITDYEAAEIFRIYNNVNKLNDQELRNAYVHELGNWVRDYSRDPYNKGTQLPVFKSATFGKGRMKRDEMLARCLYFEYLDQKESIYSQRVGKKELDDFYENAYYCSDETNLKKLTTKTINRFKFVDKVLRESQAPFLSKDHSRVVFLYLMTYALEERFGKGYKVNIPVFTKAYTEAFQNLCDKKLQGYAHRRQTRFEELMGKWMTQEVIERIGLMMSELDKMKDIGITQTDAKRVFTVEEKYRKWVEQGCVCAVSGKELKFKDAVGGHIIPHSKGGSTTYDNLVILSAEVNTEMSDMTLEEYTISKGMSYTVELDTVA